MGSRYAGTKLALITTVRMRGHLLGWLVGGRYVQATVTQRWQDELGMQGWTVALQA